MKKILHITSNYPDEITPNTTFAVKRLVQSAQSFSQNHCVSVHNVFPERKEQVIRRQDHTVICAWGLPLVLGSRAFLKRCEKLIWQSDLPLEDYDMIHAHKITLEGLIASSLAAKLRKPFCVSVRATDCLMFKYKPYLRNRYLSILESATKIAVIAPWLAEQLRVAAGAKWDSKLERKLVLVGNVVDGEQRQCKAHNDCYVMPFAVNQSQLKRKNLFRTLDAIASLIRNGRRLRLDIIGSGTGVQTVKEAIDARGLKDSVRLLGHIPHRNMLQTLSQYKALLLCSYPETFGLVYIEALISGIPLIYSRGTGVDGMFTGNNIGVSANPKSVASIAEAIETMEKNFAIYKSSVSTLQQNGSLDRFKSGAYAGCLQEQLYGISEDHLRATAWHRGETVIGVR